jgi:hypothetical protein
MDMFPTNWQLVAAVAVVTTNCAVDVEVGLSVSRARYSVLISIHWKEECERSLQTLNNEYCLTAVTESASSTLI